MPDISEGAIEVKVRRYISGQWVEGWAAASEVCGPTLTLAELSAPAQCTPKPCAKVRLLETAEKCQWSAEQVVTVARALGLK